MIAHSSEAPMLLVAIAVIVSLVIVVLVVWMVVTTWKDTRR